MMERLLPLSLCMIAVGALALPNSLPIRERADVIHRWLNMHAKTGLPAQPCCAKIDTRVISS